MTVRPTLRARGGPRVVRRRDRARPRGAAGGGERLAGLRRRGRGPLCRGPLRRVPEIVEALEPSLEAIAALRPDLILDTRSAGTQDRQEALTRIAPTISQPEGVGPYQTSWQQQLELVGQALGRIDEAGELAAQVEQDFADAAAEHPEFQGTEVAVAAFTSAGYGAYVRGDSRVDFMEQLGFENEPAIQELATENFFVPLSEEQVPCSTPS